MCIFTCIEVRKVYTLLHGWLKHDINFKLENVFSKPYKPTLIQRVWQNFSYHRSLLSLTHLKESPLAFPETPHNGY